MRSFGPSDFIYIMTALQWTIILSLGAFMGGSIGGLAVALARTSGIRVLSGIARGFIILFQGTPLLMQLFLVFFGMGLFGFNMNPWTAAFLALSLHASAFLGEIWRGCIEAVPKGQWAAGWALALPNYSLMTEVILPQAMKIALPPTVGFLVQLIKATSLAAIIGFNELMRAAQIVNNSVFEPLTVYGLVAILYFMLCWPLSLLGRRLEKALAGNDGIVAPDNLFRAGV
jgi:polar amino acid transport system permease protein